MDILRWIFGIKAKEEKPIKSKAIKPDQRLFIHIAGYPGAGKSTLGSKFKNTKNLLLIDTDAIDDPNELKLAKKSRLKTIAERRSFNRAVGKANERQIKKLIKDNPKKHVLIFGFFHLGFEFLEPKLTHRFWIKVDAETLWKRYQSRTIKSIKKHGDELLKLIENDNISAFKKDVMISNKYEIRTGFFCFSQDEGAHNLKQIYKDKGKMVQPADKIYNTIKKLLAKSKFC